MCSWSVAGVQLAFILACMRKILHVDRDASDSASQGNRNPIANDRECQFFCDRAHGFCFDIDKLIVWVAESPQIMSSKLIIKAAADEEISLKCTNASQNLRIPLNLVFRIHDDHDHCKLYIFFESC